MITSLAFISTSLALNSFLHLNYFNSFVLLNISYFFDCLDGHYARSYNMVTVFGDYYDHFSDMFKFFGLIILSYYLDYCKFVIMFPLLIMCTILMLLHMGCQEVYFSYKNNSIKAPTLSILKVFCPAENITELQGMMKLTRFMGTGTFNLMLSLIPIFYSFN